MIWFTSDTHFNHPNVIQHDRRPFADIDEMTEAIIERWNSVVARGDVVYHLGDFAITWGKRDYPCVDQILSRLNGTKHLIQGNHDRDQTTKNPRWAKVSSLDEIKPGSHTSKIVLCHYAMRTWNQSHRGSWMLHGHSHGNLPWVGGKTMDVGTMRFNYYPISIDQVADIMASRTILVVDHHGAEHAHPPVIDRPSKPDPSTGSEGDPSQCDYQSHLPDL